jgi:hypothetical protein
MPGLAALISAVGAGVLAVSLAVGGGAASPGPAHAAPAEAAQGQRIRAYVTGYSFYDNYPARSGIISHPVLHRRAGGTGTYGDPITVAVGFTSSRLDWAPGTRFYIPNLQRYFIVEDTCSGCHWNVPSPARTWLDVWVDGSRRHRWVSDRAMWNLTGIQTVIKDPPADLAVRSGRLS